MNSMNSGRSSLAHCFSAASVPHLGPLVVDRCAGKAPCAVPRRPRPRHRLPGDMATWRHGEGRKLRCLLQCHFDHTVSQGTVEMMYILLPIFHDVRRGVVSFQFVSSFEPFQNQLPSSPKHPKAQAIAHHEKDMERLERLEASVSRSAVLPCRLGSVPTPTSERRPCGQAG